MALHETKKNIWKQPVLASLYITYSQLCLLVVQCNVFSVFRLLNALSQQVRSQITFLKTVLLLCGVVATDPTRTRSMRSEVVENGVVCDRSKELLVDVHDGTPLGLQQ